MATFTRTSAPNPTGFNWGDVIQWLVIGIPTTTTVVLSNTDGTINVITGTGFTFDVNNFPLSGNISSIEQQPSGGGAAIRTLVYAPTDPVHTLDAMFNSAPSVLQYLLDANDTMIGNGGSNSLNAHAGDDTLRGLAGNDALDGGLGFDEARYDRDAAAGGAGAVNVNLATGIAIDGFGNTDTLINIESVRGTNQADTLTGGNTANNGFEGFRGLGGNDTISGGAGFDEVRYDQDSANGGGAAVSVNLVTQSATDGFGNTDVLSGIEGARGTLLGDSFLGDANNNTFTGLQGADTINGGDGFDTLRYDVDANFGGAAGVTVNLVAGTATDGFGTFDSLQDIENVRGTANADTITGNGWDNEFNGGGGNDTLTGGDGFDFFNPGSGTDTVNGAPGTNPDQSYDDQDYVSYNDGTNGVGVIVNLSNAAITQTIGAGTFTVAATSARDWSGATDTLIDIERARGTNQADYLRGSDTANLRGELLEGLAGNDTLNGGLGSDSARYDRDDDNGGLSGVIVNLSGASINATITAGTFTVASNTARDGFGNTDTLIGIENARGTASNDVFVGDGNRNTFRIIGGSDTIDGGNGDDAVSMYVDDSFPPTGAAVDLAAHTATALNGGVSTLISIEDVNGSTGADQITGDGLENLLFGDFGNDTIGGGGGGDMIDGGPGNNALDGGVGPDDVVSYMYDPAYAKNYNLQYPTQLALIDQGVTVNLLAGVATNWSGGTDTLVNFEDVVGTFFNDDITGDNGDNVFDGLAGNDTINGGGGSDTVYYGTFDQIGRVQVLLAGINGSDPTVSPSISRARSPATARAAPTRCSTSRMSSAAGATTPSPAMRSAIGWMVELDRIRWSPDSVPTRSPEDLGTIRCLAIRTTIWSKVASEQTRSSAVPVTIRSMATRQQPAGRS